MKHTIVIKNSLKDYFNKCVRDAYQAEEREYKEGEEDIQFEFILIRRYSVCPSLFQIYPVVFKTPYNRVTGRVERRMARNVCKHFGVGWKNSKCVLSDGSSIDPIRVYLTYQLPGTQSLDFDTVEARLILEDKTLVDVSVLHQGDIEKGRILDSYKTEQLLIKHMNMSQIGFYSSFDIRKYTHDRNLEALNPYMKLLREDCKDWQKYKELYKETFGVSLGSDYEIITSSGIGIL